MSDVALSVLDLSPIAEGSHAGEALRHSLDLAQHVERLGYRRFWLAEHHNMTGIASAATSVVIGFVAGGTSTIRVGAGGVMLPNHSPLVIAEQFGTLAALYPGRIDLGLGRAPGTDARTSQALRRDVHAAAERFPQDVQELQAYFRPASQTQAIRAVPGAGLEVPIWILGSSLFGAQLAATLGLPFAFASHFAPDQLMAAIDIYRTRFRASDTLPEPYVMVGVNVFAADTDEQADVLFSSLVQAFANLVRGRPGPLPAPRRGVVAELSAMERSSLDRMLACSVVGGQDTVRAGLQAIAQRTGASELILTGQIHEHAARLRSFTIAAEAWQAVVA